MDAYAESCSFSTPSQVAFEYKHVPQGLTKRSAAGVVHIKADRSPMKRLIKYRKRSSPARSFWILEEMPQILSQRNSAVKVARYLPHMFCIVLN